jgi:hypothetical protein
MSNAGALLPDASSMAVPTTRHGFDKKFGLKFALHRWDQVPAVG